MKYTIFVINAKIYGQKLFECAPSRFPSSLPYDIWIVEILIYYSKIIKKKEGQIKV